MTLTNVFLVILLMGVIIMLSRLFKVLRAQKADMFLKFDTLENQINNVKKEHNDNLALVNTEILCIKYDQHSQSKMIKDDIGDFKKDQDDKVSRLEGMMGNVRNEQMNHALMMKDKINIIQNDNNRQLMILNRIVSLKQNKLKAEDIETVHFLPDKIEYSNGRSDIIFNKIELPSINAKNYNVVEEALKSALPATIINAVAMCGASGLYQATVPIETLIKYANGTLSSMVRGSQGIAGHVGFIPAGTACIFTPLIAFQVLSIITGQYYMQGITTQLNKIRSRLEYLTQLHHNEKISKLQADYERLFELSGKNHYEIEDLIEVRMCIDDAYAIHREYSNLTRNIDTKDFYKSITNNILVLTSSMFKKLDSKRQETGIMFNADLLLFSRRLLFTSKLVELKANVYLSRGTPERIMNISPIVNDFCKIMEDNDLTSRNLAKILNEVEKVAHDIKKRALTGSRIKKAEEALSKYSSENKNLVKNITELTADIKKTYEKIKDNFDKKQDVYIMIDRDGIQHPLCSQL